MHENQKEDFLEEEDAKKIEGAQAGWRPGAFTLPNEKEVCMTPCGPVHHDLMGPVKMCRLDTTVSGTFFEPFELHNFPVDCQDLNI